MDHLEQTLSRLNASIDKLSSMKRGNERLSWGLAIAIAALGGLIAAASVREDNQCWLLRHEAIAFYGVLTAIGAAVNKVVDPQARAERLRKTKRACQLILNRLQEAVAQNDHRFTSFDAERLRIVAKNDPDRIIEMFLGLSFGDAARRTGNSAPAAVGSDG